MERHRAWVWEESFDADGDAVRGEKQECTIADALSLQTNPEGVIALLRRLGFPIAENQKLYRLLVFCHVLAHRTEAELDAHNTMIRGSTFCVRGFRAPWEWIEAGSIYVWLVDREPS